MALGNVEEVTNFNESEKLKKGFNSRLALGKKVIDPTYTITLPTGLLLIRF